MQSTEEKESMKKRIRKKSGYVFGGMVLCAIAMVVIPEVMPRISGAMNKKTSKALNSRRNEDDWGLIIEKKNK